MMDQRAAVIALTKSKYSEIALEFQANEAELVRLRKRQEELHEEARKCYTVANLFGFDLMVEMAISQQQPDMFPQRRAEAPAALIAHKSIRDILHDLIQSAYPKPVRAKHLLEELKAMGFAPHEKTVGMTLYRMSKPTDGSVRRAGKADWYFVPENQRQQAPERETRGDEPGDVSTDGK